MTTKFADIIVPLPLAQTYTYSIPEDMENQIAVGMRVIVHFGTSKFYTGIVANIHSNHPAYDKIKPISEIIDDKPILLPSQLQLWNFVSQYYQSALGDVYKTALPSGLKIENESIIELVPEILESYDSKFSKSEQKIIDTLSDEKSHSITEFTTSQLKHIKHLIDIGIIAKTEKTTDNYKPKFTDFIVINPIYKDNADKALQIIGKAKKQYELFEQYVALSNYSTISRQQLLEQTKISASILKQLIEKGILQIEKRRCYRIDTTSEISSATHQLTPVQQTAYEEIKSGFATHQSILLHGITSSGKTEIYIQLIKDCISKGKQVLMLVPEAGLTQQLANRLKQFFGGEMGIFHSFCSSYERVETYQHQLSDNPYKLILGVRSSIFLPFKNLGLIIIDEEHDMGYKQIEPSPRYHARDVATLLARIHNAKTLLGSATPSIETYANCYNGKYKLVELNERYGGVSLPEIKLIDIKECYRKKQMKGHFSLEMIETIKHCIEAGEQVILFQNRRGFAPYIKCAQCGYVPKCPNCDVSLTYHRHNNTLTCHYCGHTVPINNHERPTTFNTQLSAISSFCPQCHEGQLSTHGFGTEQVEDEVKALFPDFTVTRLDLDTSRSAKAFDSIVGAFQKGEIDILIGTQMVAKGLDFDNVSLVAVLNADSLLNTPDFRSHETAFQMLEQVAGRAGRRGERGEVIIQTFMPDHPIFAFLSRHDYVGLYQHQIAERQLFHYPPFYRLIDITLKHRNNDRLLAASTLLQERLQQVFGHRCSPIIIPSVARMHNTYLRHILLRIEGHADIQRAKQLLMESIHYVQSLRNCLGTIIIPDVDPM
jgi:primosomal protein N' (replication factor Y)